MSEEVDNQTQQRDCIACPRGEKAPAEYNWHNGGLGVFPNCEACLRDSLVRDVDDLSGYKRRVYEEDGPEGFVAGFAKPHADPSVKIVTEADLDAYLDADVKA